MVLWGSYVLDCFQLIRGQWLPAFWLPPRGSQATSGDFLKRGVDLLIKLLATKMSIYSFKYKLSSRLNGSFDGTVCVPGKHVKFSVLEMACRPVLIHLSKLLSWLIICLGATAKSVVIIWALTTLPWHLAFPLEGGLTVLLCGCGVSAGYPVSQYISVHACHFFPLFSLKCLVTQLHADLSHGRILLYSTMEIFRWSATHDWELIIWNLWGKLLASSS